MGEASSRVAALRRTVVAALVGAGGVSLAVGVASARLEEAPAVTARVPHTLAVAAAPVSIVPGYTRERSFTGRVEETARVGNRDAIVPSIEGWARITGFNTLFIDERDPYAHGFQVV